jgi:ferredoxin--NADP+ reductase
METGVNSSLPFAEEARHFVAVIGAGPAGIFAARELAANGVQVCLFNRDIKPGGLAEYGIYPDKLKLRAGLHAQFCTVLHSPGIHYFGNVNIQRNGDLSLDDLRSLGFQALLVTAGAQGTKWLGLPGEHLDGIYHAKEFVYHYNRLPPFSQRTYTTGKRVGVVGIGNVMADITHYLAQERQADEVIAIARRGPMEAKFDRRELESIVGYIDPGDLNTELERVSRSMKAVGQDAQSFIQLIQSAREKTVQHATSARLKFRFLSSPLRFLGDERGQVRAVEVEDNRLEIVDGAVTARGTGSTSLLELDTVIFAIGDTVDEGMGLPIIKGEFIKHPQPRFPMDGQSFEAYDPAHPTALDDVFLAGWSRKASTGLVGLAHKDGVNAARAILHYLENQPPSSEASLEHIFDTLRRLDKPVITVEDFDRLESVERAHAAELGVETFKFDNNQDMLEAAGLSPVLAGVSSTR